APIAKIALTARRIGIAAARKRTRIGCIAASTPWAAPGAGTAALCDLDEIRVGGRRSRLRQRRRRKARQSQEAKAGQELRANVHGSIFGWDAHAAHCFRSAFSERRRGCGARPAIAKAHPRRVIRNGENRSLNSPER